MKKRAILATITTILLLCLVGITEKILAARSPHSVVRRQRVIRLREAYPPLTDTFVTPPRDYRKDSDGLTKRKYRLRLDKNGFIMPAGVHDDPDVTIVFLGGSTTQCLFCNEENRFPCRAARRLEEKTGLTVNSYNGALRGTDSLSSINVLINKGLPLNPDIVVMMHNANDRGTLKFEGTYWNENLTRSPILEMNKGPEDFGAWIDQGLTLAIPNLYERGKYVFRKISTGTGRPDEFARTRRERTQKHEETDRVDAFKRNLRIFGAICKAAGSKPVLMTQPVRNRDAEDPKENMFEWHEQSRVFNDAIRDVCAEEDIMLIDLAREVPATKEHIYDWLHYKDAGAQLVGDIIARELAETLPFHANTRP